LAAREERAARRHIQFALKQVRLGQFIETAPHQCFGLGRVQTIAQLRLQLRCHLRRAGSAIAHLPHFGGGGVQRMHFFALPVVQAQFIVQSFGVHGPGLLWVRHGIPPRRKM
jgi:hypothetical protein